jgi:hypothetical protein
MHCAFERLVEISVWQLMGLAAPHAPCMGMHKRSKTAACVLRLYTLLAAEEEFVHDGVPKQEMGGVPIIAEDLGVITDDVVQLREAIGAPGMVVLQFAWGGGPTNVHLPHNHYENSVCYPGAR